MAGDWHTVTKGSMICSFGTGTITIDSNGVTGFSDVGGFPGAVKLRFSPPSVYLTYNYTDSLGNDDALAIYEGILSADKNTVTGTVGGTWEDNCTFTMRRR